jgi:hypothetical protein
MPRCRPWSGFKSANIGLYGLVLGRSTYIQDFLSPSSYYLFQSLALLLAPSLHKSHNEFDFSANVLIFPPAPTMSNINGTITIIPAPEGYIVDFDNPQMQYVAQSYIVAAVEMTLAFLFLLQRLYTKIVIVKQFQLEDGELLYKRYTHILLTSQQLLSSLPRSSVWVHRYACCLVLLVEPTGGMPGRSALINMLFIRG